MNFSKTWIFLHFPIKTNKNLRHLICSLSFQQILLHQIITELDNQGFAIWNLLLLVTNIRGPIESRCEVSRLTSRSVRLLDEQSVEHCEELAKQTTAWQWMYTTLDWLDVNWKVFKLNRASLAGDGRKCIKLTLEHLNGRRNQSI